MPKKPHPDTPIDTNNMPKESQAACEEDNRGGPGTTPNSRRVGLIKSLIIIFSFTSKLDYVLLVLPAFLLSVLSGLLPAYMTILIGQAFQLFADYTITITGATDSTTIIDQAKDTLRQKIGLVAIKLVSLGCATFLLSLVTHTLWAINGSKICEKIQATVYDSVSQRELGWFENGMKTRYRFLDEESDNNDSGSTNERSSTSQSPAGLMARFAR
jgi:ATP-binding cassette subfamily B (MDR/TAP) protein 1